MAFQPQDYSFKGQAPMAAIMQAYQNKARQEFQMKQQAEQAKRAKTQDTLNIINQASQLVQQGVQMSTARQQKDANKAVSQLMGRAGEAATRLDSTTGELTRQTFGETPEYRSMLLQELSKSQPEFAQQEQIKALMKESETGALDDLSGRDVQTQEFLMADGNRKMLAIYETTVPPRVIDVATGKDLSPEEMKGMRRAPVSTQTASGYTSGGKLINRDREGNLTVHGKPYKGSIYEKLKTPPASLVQGRASLDIAKETLKDVKLLFRPNLTGPVTGRYQSVAKLLNSLSEEDRTKFTVSLNSYRNAMIKAITGAQMSEPEAKRLMKQMPDEKTSPKNFLNQLDYVQRETNRRISIHESTLKRAGYALVRENTISDTEAARLVDKAMEKYPLKSKRKSLDSIFGGGL